MALSDQFNRRVRRRDIKSTALAQEGMGSISAKGSLIATAVTTLGNGEQSVITGTLSSEKEFDLFGVEPYFAFYVGGISSANQLPGGSGIDESQWQMINVGYNYAAWNKSKYQAKYTYYIRNISAGAGKVIYVVSQWKYLSRQ